MFITGFRTTSVHTFIQDGGVSKANMGANPRRQQCGRQADMNSHVCPDGEGAGRGNSRPIPGGCKRRSAFHRSDPILHTILGGAYHNPVSLELELKFMEFQLLSSNRRESNPGLPFSSTSPQKQKCQDVKC